MVALSVPSTSSKMELLNGTDLAGDPRLPVCELASESRLGRRYALVTDALLGVLASVTLELCLLCRNSWLGLMEGVNEYFLVGTGLAGEVFVLDRCCNVGISGPEAVLGRTIAVAIPIFTSKSESSEGRDGPLFASMSIARGRGLSAQGSIVEVMPSGAVFDRLRVMGSAVLGRDGGDARPSAEMSEDRRWRWGVKVAEAGKLEKMDSLWRGGEVVESLRSPLSRGFDFIKARDRRPRVSLGDFYRQVSKDGVRCDWDSPFWQASLVTGMVSSLGCR